MYRFPHNCQIPNLSSIYEEAFGTFKGIFVEVGGYDGESFSNSSGLADKGWRGVYIEPVPSFMESCKKRHANNFCTYHQVAISNKPGTMTLTLGDAITTGSQEIAQVYHEIMWSRNVITNQKIQVPVLTLNQVLELEKIKYFDVLIVDVEGLETDVFEGFDLEKYKPKVLIVELEENHPDLGHKMSGELKNRIQELRDRIIKNGYKLKYEDFINTVYIRS